MNCPQCQEELAPWRVITVSFWSGWRCPKCEIRFYLDLHDYKKKTVLPGVVTISAMLIVVFASQSLFPTLLYPGLILVVVAMMIWHHLIMLRTKVVLNLDGEIRREHKFLRLGCLMGALSMELLYLHRVIPGHSNMVFLIGIPSLFLALWFFAKARASGRKAQEKRVKASRSL